MTDLLAQERRRRRRFSLVLGLLSVVSAAALYIGITSLIQNSGQASKDSVRVVTKRVVKLEKRVERIRPSRRSKARRRSSRTGRPTPRSTQRQHGEHRPGHSAPTPVRPPSSQEPPSSSQPSPPQPSPAPRPTLPIPLPLPPLPLCVTRPVVLCPS